MRHCNGGTEKNIETRLKMVNFPVTNNLRKIAVARDVYRRKKGGN